MDLLDAGEGEGEAMALDFQPAATGYSLVNALYLANACHAAYQPALDTAAASADLAFTAPVTEFRNGQGIRGFVGLRVDGVILSFQGTADIPGWMTDANIVQIEDAVYDGR